MSSSTPTFMYKLLDENALPPNRLNGSDGYDLSLLSVERKDGMFICHTGVSICPPEGYTVLLLGRSSLQDKGYAMGNGVGLIDSNYRGEYIVKLFVIPGMVAVPLVPGERYFQIVFVNYGTPTPKLTNELPASSRGDGAFGSTDDKDDDEKSSKKKDKKDKKDKKSSKKKKEEESDEESEEESDEEDSKKKKKSSKKKSSKKKDEESDDDKEDKKKKRK